MKHRFFTVLVIGDEPEKLMEKYKMSNDAALTLKYRYSDKHELRTKMLEYIKSAICISENNVHEMLQAKYNVISDLSDEEYFQVISEGCIYDEYGNAFTTENMDGKYDYYQKSSNFSIPLVTFDGKETMSDIKKNIDWDKLHKHDVHVYERVWEMVMEKDAPKNEEEDTWYKNMKDHKEYLEQFETKQHYADYCSSYWTYAYLDENGWKDASEVNMDEWILNYYNNFIEPLKSQDKITLYEYTVPLDIS